MSGSLVSIIVPIYGVEKYIEKCAIWLFEQDYEDIEYIFVNDCSPDNSMEILQNVIEKYPNRKNSIKIINKAKNEGLGQARKSGFEVANGEYIMHIDSDDWLELDAVSHLVCVAKKSAADIVACDYFINYNDKEIYKKENYENISQEDMLKSLLSDVIMPCVWNKIYKKEIFRGVKFANFQMGEDMFLTTQLFYNAKKIAYLNRAFLHYNQTNISALTKIVSDKKINDLKNLNISIENFLKEKNIFDKFADFHYIRMNYMGFASSVANPREFLNMISPNAKKIKYIWKNQNSMLFTKIGFTLRFYNLNLVYNILLKFYYFIKASKK